MLRRSQRQLLPRHLSGRGATACQRSWLIMSWRLCSSRRTPSQRICPEAIVIESDDVFTTTVCDATTVHENHVRPQERSVGGSTAGDVTSSASSPTALFLDVTTVDTFARGRVANYLRRMGHAPAQLYHTRCLTQQEREAMCGPGQAVSTGGATGDVYLTQIRVPLPPPHGSYLAEGLAESVKDAEWLAAMHAEYVCDALAVPLYSLPSMQRKHAEAARRVGRYAPLPGDPVRPEGTHVPPPLRMLAGGCHASRDPNRSMGTSSVPHVHLSDGNLAQGETGAGSTEAPAHRFTASIAEAEIVCHTPSSSSTRSPRRLQRVFPEPHRPAAPWELEESDVHGGAEPSVASPSSSAVVWRYTDIAWYPWRQARTPEEVLAEEGEDDLPLPELLTMVGGLTHPAAGSSSHVQPATRAPPPASRPQRFDPTEGGMWQMVQPLSTRCSPAPEDALVLPYVYDEAHALERMRVYYQQHNTSLDDHLSFTHVTVPRHSGRMYVATLHLVDVHASVTAKGKAQSKDVALNLAAMHAELLLDAMGRPLFPRDAARQQRHATAVKRFGRWACDGGVTGQSPSFAPAKGDGEDGAVGDVHDALPLPLKQQVGGDDVWLNLTRPHTSAYTRSEGETIVALHNVLAHHYADAIEVKLPVDVLERAPDILRRWQLTVAESKYPELYVLTRLGDAYRAVTLTPVPRCYGVRGGTAIGKTMEQAVQLCALHALDTLCSLGIPVDKDPARHDAYLAWRRQNGFVTSDDVRGMHRPAFVVPLKHSVVAAGVCEEAHAAVAESRKETLSESDVPPVPQFVKDALNTAPGVAPQRRRPYLPSYIAEGSVVRLPPRIADTLYVMQLDIPEHLNVFGCAEVSEAHRVELGNAARICVHNYIQHQHAAYTAALRQEQTSPPPQSLTSPHAVSGKGCVDGSVGGAGVLSLAERCTLTPRPEEASLWWRQWLAAPPMVNPHIFITGFTKQISVYNYAYMRIPLPLTHATLSALTDGGEGAAPPSVLALGLALKKRDAERMCFVHAAAMLHALAGEDVLQRYPTGLPRQGGVTSYTAHLMPHITAYAETTSAEEATTPSRESVPGIQYCRPLMYATMKSFLESGKYYVPPRRRNHTADLPSAP